MESTEHLKLNIPDYNNLADIEVLNDNFRLIDKNAKETKGEVDSKEPKIQVKKTGFNLDKTDSTENDTNKLFTAKGALNLFNSLSELINSLSTSIGTVSTNLSNHILKKVSISEDGHMAKEDKIKLDGIAVGANKYTLPIANTTVLGGVKIGNGINIDGTGTISIIPAREGLIPIGALLLLDNVNNPALMFPGTTWSKIEERFLYGTSGATGQVGGRNSFSLTVAQMPKHNHSGWTDQQGNHNHTQDSHAHTQPVHSHNTDYAVGGVTVSKNGEFTYLAPFNSSHIGYFGGRTSMKTTNGGGENTGGAQPGIHYSGQHSHNIGIGEAGSGEAINIMPQYYTINIWKRLS